MHHSNATERIDRGSFELRFQSLFNAGRALAFPCNAQGQVDLKTLSERGARNYSDALVAIGREYSVPVVVPGGCR